MSTLPLSVYWFNDFVYTRQWIVLSLRGEWTVLRWFQRPHLTPTALHIDHFIQFTTDWNSWTSNEFVRLLAAFNFWQLSQSGQKVQLVSRCNNIITFKKRTSLAYLNKPNSSKQISYFCMKNKQSTYNTDMSILKDVINRESADWAETFPWLSEQRGFIAYSCNWTEWFSELKA